MTHDNVYRDDREVSIEIKNILDRRDARVSSGTRKVLHKSVGGSHPLLLPWSSTREDRAGVSRVRHARSPLQEP
jgi:hypothetical protein